MGYRINQQTGQWEWIADYYGQMPPPQPQPQPPAQAAQQEEKLLLVADEMEARAQRIPYGSALMMMDRGKDVFYIKKVDSAGNADFRAYNLVEVPQPAPADFATRAELNQLTATINQLAGTVNQLAGMIQPPVTEGATKNEQNP